MLFASISKCVNLTKLVVCCEGASENSIRLLGTLPRLSQMGLDAFPLTAVDALGSVVRRMAHILVRLQVRLKDGWFTDAFLCCFTRGFTRLRSLTLDSDSRDNNHWFPMSAGLVGSEENSTVFLEDDFIRVFGENKHRDSVRAAALNVFMYDRRGRPWKIHRNIDKLSIRERVSGTQIARFIEACSHLQVLFIRGVERVTDATLNAVAKHGKHLLNLSLLGEADATTMFARQGVANECPVRGPGCIGDECIDWDTVRNPTLRQQTPWCHLYA
jgi:hypothetical protein